MNSRIVAFKNKNNFYVITGNFLEFFDLFMYIHLAHIIQKYYFVGANEDLLTAFTFANLYLIAPIGCIIFAYLGDTLGHKKVIVSTSILMAFCSSMIGVIPTSHNIGAYAGIILIFVRVLQGISLSGEPLAAGLYLIESTPLRYAPLFVSLLRATECLGGAIALGISYTAIYFWGEPAWRVPFYLGILFCFFSLWLRWNLAESKEYLQYTSEHQKRFKAQQKKGLWEFYSTLNFRHRNFICGIGLGGYTYGTAFSISYVYLGNFLMRQFGLMALGWACSRLFSFFMIGVVLNFIALPYNISWMVGIMILMTVIFLPSLIFYIPYNKQDDSFFDKSSSILKKFNYL